MLFYLAYRRLLGVERVILAVRMKKARNDPPIYRITIFSTTRTLLLVHSLCSILYTEVKKCRKASGQLGGGILPTPTFSFFPHQTIHVAPFSASKHGVRKDRVFAQLCAISSMAKATVSLNYDEHHSAHRLPRWQKMPLCQLSVRAGVPESINSCRPIIIPYPEPRGFSHHLYLVGQQNSPQKKKKTV